MGSWAKYNKKVVRITKEEINNNFEDESSSKESEKPIDELKDNNSEIVKYFEQKTKEMSLGKEVIDALDREELQKQYLDIGYVDKTIKGSKGIPDEITKFFYYGFLYDNKEAILTSDKKIYVNRQVLVKREIQGIDEIKEFFDYDGTIGCIAPVISKRRIKEWLLTEKRLDKIEVFNRVLDKINYYMDFDKQEEIAYIQACWVIATHCYPLFDWFPHILFNAPVESGKTKNAKLLMKMSFRGFNFGAVAGLSPPQFFRTLEGNRGTILIDEYEKRENSEHQATVNQMLNASASYDEFVIRLEQINNKWVDKLFPIFCPKMICNISGINSTSLSRLIVFQLIKTLNKDKSKRKPNRDIELCGIRDDISILILENWQEIKEIYDNIEVDFIGRDVDNWKSILAIAKWLGNDIEKYIIRYIQTYMQIKADNHDTLGEFFLALYDKVSEDNQFYQPKEIANWEIMIELIGHYKSPPTWIGKTLKSYKFESTRGGGGKKYKLSKSLVGGVVARYFGSIPPPPPEASQATQATQATHLFSIVNNVGGVGSVGSEAFRGGWGIEKTHPLNNFNIENNINTKETLPNTTNPPNPTQSTPILPNVGCVFCKTLRSPVTDVTNVTHVTETNIMEKYSIEHTDLTILQCAYCGLVGDGQTHTYKGKLICLYCLNDLIKRGDIGKTPHNIVPNITENIVDSPKKSPADNWGGSNSKDSPLLLATPPNFIKSKTPIFFALQTDYDGICGYCGHKKYLSYRDQDGNHACYDCIMSYKVRT